MPSVDLKPMYPGEEGHSKVAKAVREMMTGLATDTDNGTLFSALLAAYSEFCVHLGLSRETALRGVREYFEQNHGAKS